MRTLVSLDLETTGLDSERDEIIEIGIVRFRGDEILDKWSSLIRPQREIPSKIIELTGISNEMVRSDGIPLWDGLREAQRVAGNFPIVGHNIMFDLGFTRRQRVFVTNPAIDTFELAGILIPHAGQYSLSALARELDIELADAHRALNDALTAHQLYQKVFERATELPTDVLEEITSHAKRSGWTLAEFWQDALETQSRGVFSTSLAARLKRSKTGQTDLARKAAMKARVEARPLKPVDDPTPLDVDQVAHTLDTDGPFSQHFEGYEARPPQVEMMRTVATAFNESAHALVEAGTGTGKCLTGDTWVTYQSGRRQQIQDIISDTRLISEPILCIDSSGKLIYQHISGVHSNGIRQVWRLKTALGRIITATGNHPFMTFGGWQHLSDLKIGDRIATVRRLPAGVCHIPDHEAFVAGAMLGDGGCIRPDAVDFTNFDPEVVSAVACDVAKLGNVQMTTKLAKGHFGFRRLSLLRHQRSGLNLLLEGLDMLGRDAHDKHIPAIYFEADAESICHLLAGLWVTDGSFERRDGNLTFSSASHRMISEIQHLLLKLEIISRVRYKQAKLKDKVFDSWHLTISDKRSKSAFRDTVGKYMVGKRKVRVDQWWQEESNREQRFNPNDDLIPDQAWLFIDQDRQKVDKSWYSIRKECVVSSDRDREISRDKMRKIGEFLQSSRIVQIAASDIYWDRVTAIEPVGEAETYDLTMEGEPNFIANDIVVHNSLAYLIPSIMWAMQNGERVVISTNTINLQEQLAEKDVPAINAALGIEGRAAVMKGKSRYLCPLRLNDLRRNGPKTLEEVRLLTKILIWLPNTLTGDGDELFIPAPPERAAFLRLSAQNPSCNVGTCSATDCYFHQARRLAESAHVVIVNHALLLADIAVENRALPEYHYLVVDEAHHLESAATDSLAFRIDRDEMLHQLADLLSTSGRRASGLLAEITAFARQWLPVTHGAALENFSDQAANVLSRMSTQVVAFFDELLDFLSDRSNGESFEYAQRIRITRSLRNEQGWTRVESAFENLKNEMTALARSLDGLSRAMNELSDVHNDATGESGQSLEMLTARALGAKRFMDEACEQMNAIISKPGEQSIYWVEMQASSDRGGYARKTGSARVTLNAAPLNVGPLMRKFIWDAKKSVILTSATIRTSSPTTRGQPTFDHIEERLDAENALTLAVESPFDYTASTLLYLVSDMPEPNQPSYQQYVERALLELFRASRGRGMALFTSYNQLRVTARNIAPQLLREGIVVYEQGDGTSRRIMLEQFKAAERGVLFGTRSFWEGVDVQGEKLSALAICKLPFDVPTDPIFSARSETYEDPFNEYSVPETVLRFRQGFGRLIRAKTDRGVIVVLDRRLISKNYGASFINALPSPTIRRGPLTGLSRSVTEWLK